jgi:hypothetical protein
MVLHSFTAQNVCSFASAAGLATLGELQSYENKDHALDIGLDRPRRFVCIQRTEACCTSSSKRGSIALRSPICL